MCLSQLHRPFVERSVIVSTHRALDPGPGTTTAAGGDDEDEDEEDEAELSIHT